jgi:hypothetical protein
MAKKRKIKNASAISWQDRIVESGSIDPEQLQISTKNWRVHPANQKVAMQGVLDSVGWVGQVIVNRTTGNLLDGHLRVELALDAAEKSIPVTYVELTEHEENLVLATFDTLTNMAGVNTDKIVALLEDVVIPDPRIQIALDTLDISIDSLADELDEDLMDDDEDVTRQSEDPFISYTIIFDDEIQQGAWHKALRWLQVVEPELSVGQRVALLLDSCDYEKALPIDETETPHEDA